MEINNQIKYFKKSKRKIKSDPDYNDYVKSFIYRDVEVDVFCDDYGQCYYVKFTINERLHEMSCGTYNFNYEQEAMDMVDYYLRKTNNR